MLLCLLNAISVRVNLCYLHDGFTTVTRKKRSRIVEEFRRLSAVSAKNYKATEWSEDFVLLPTVVNKIRLSPDFPSRLQSLTLNDL
jgi:hypothetical protein